MASKTKKTKFNLESVAKDLIELHFDSSDTLENVNKKFYKIMKKHGIKHGTKEGNGIRCANFEWTICFEMFLTRVRNYFEFNHLFNDDIPEDLKYY